MSAMSVEHQKFWSAGMQLWRDPTERTWILVNPTSIGDTYVVCALARAFKATHGGKLTMVMKQSQLPIAHMFQSDIDRMLAYEDQELLSFSWKFFGVGSFDIDQPIMAHPQWHGAGHDFHQFAELFAYPGRGGLTFADWFRLMLRLGWDTELSKPNIPDEWRAAANAYADQIGMTEGKSIILFPDNNSQAPLPDAFWSQLAERLSAEGLTVFTNMAGNRHGPRTVPLPGTSGVHITLANVIPLVERAGRFVSMSNGMSSMLTGSGARTRHAYVIQVPAPGAEVMINGIHVRQPVIVQTQAVIGLAKGPFNEFKVESLGPWDQPIGDVARLMAPPVT